MKKKNTLARVLTVFLILTLIIAGVLGYTTYYFRNDDINAQVTINALSSEMEDNSVVVYVAADDLKAGTVLAEDVNVFEQKVYTSLTSDSYISEEDLGKTLLVDVAYETPIYKDMVTEEEVEKDTREYEIMVANLMTDQQVNDYVDVRIMFPTGEDMLVLSKLRVKKLDLENALFYANLSESEILTLASATIDAYTISGTKIYTVRYVEPTLQEDAVPNYPVNTDVLSLMASDPNILEVAQQTLNYNARIALQNKLSTLSEEWFEAVAGGMNIADTAGSTALSERIEAEDEALEESEESVEEVEEE